MVGEGLLSLFGMELRGRYPTRSRYMRKPTCRDARIIQKKSFAAQTATAVGLGLMLASGVAAKPSHCRKDCKQDIKNCVALVPKNKDCTGTKAEKTACRKMHAAQRRACRSLVKLCRRSNVPAG